MIALLGSLMVQVLLVPSGWRELTGPGGGGPLSYALAVIAVQRQLRVQAVEARDRAATLQSELDEVI